MAVNGIGNASPLSQTAAQVKKVLAEVAVPFKNILDDALMAQSERVNPYQGLKDPLSKTKESSQAASVQATDAAQQLAQALPGEVPPETPPQEEEGQFLPGPVNEEMRSKRFELTPFQLFLNRAVDALEDVSATQMRVNDLIEQYIQGKASIDEVTIEAQKMSMSISFATSVITSATTTFKEILQMQV